jgi:hypothetical protein
MNIRDDDTHAVADRLSQSLGDRGGKLSWHGVDVEWRLRNVGLDAKARHGDQVDDAELTV